MKSSFIAIIFVVLTYSVAIAQVADPTLLRIGVMNGNNIAISVHNDGGMAGNTAGVDIRAEWPQGSGTDYIGDFTPMIGVEFQNTLGDILHSVIISRGPLNGQSSKHDPQNTHFWGWDPLTGYLNPNQSNIAVNTDPNSWPTTWADHPEYGSNVWDGLFGPDSSVANLEAYFQMNDSRYDAYNAYFHPDSTDLTKKGCGINVGVRYFQLTDSMFNDVLIRMYDITNTGTHFYKKVVFGAVTGTLIGGDGDSQDDLGFFDPQFNYTYSWDGDGIGNHGQKVGMVAEGFLEAPGNSHDGIDNNGNSQASSSPTFTASDFDPKIYSIGDKVVLIDPATYQRTLHTITAAVETVYSMGVQFIIVAGVTQFREVNITNVQNGIAIPDPTAYDGIDNDLDGVIDENQSVDLDARNRQGYPGLKYKNYVTGAGVNDPLIDEQSEQGGLASFDFFNVTASPPMNNDEILWAGMRPGYFNVVPPQPQDGDYIYGTNYFSLAAGETKRVVNVLAFGNSKDELTQKILAARALWNSKFNKDTVVKAVAFTNLGSHKRLTGIDTLRWTSTRTGGYVDLWYSKDHGVSWSAIAVSLPNTGTYSLNTNTIQQSPFGVFKIFIKDEAGNIYAFAQSHDVTIDNSTRTPPFIQILDQGFVQDQVITADTLNMQCLISDVESDSVKLKLWNSYDDGSTYSLSDSFNVASDTLPQPVTINIRRLLNSSKLVLKLEAVKDTLSSTVVTSSFNKQTRRDTISTAHRGIISGFATVPWRVDVVDSSKLTGHDYFITFDDGVTGTGNKYLTVNDSTSHQIVLNHQQVVPFSESAMFDGLTFYDEDAPTSFDTARSHPTWGNGEEPELQGYTVNLFHSGSSANTGYPMPNDYAIIFYPNIVDTSIEDTLTPAISSNIYPAVPTNFHVKNLSTNQYIHFCYKKNLTVSTLNYALWLKENLLGTMKRTWAITLFYNQTSDSLPKSDTLYIYFKKGLSVLDTIHVFNITTSVKKMPGIPTSYSLDQNYPNPFNPTTNFGFRVPNYGLVTLKIYDVLGREVTTLVNQKLSPGIYSLPWNATNMPTGVYFYRLQAGTYSETKKLLLMK